MKNQNLLLDQIQMQKNMAVQSGDLEMAEQLNNAEKFTRNIVRAAAVSPENVTADQLDLVVEKQKLLEKRKKLGTATKTKKRRQKNNIFKNTPLNLEFTFFFISLPSKTDSAFLRILTAS